MDRLLYATPTGGHPHPQYVQSLRVMDMGVRSFGVRRPEDFIMTFGPVHMARTKIAQATLEGRCFVEHNHDGESCRKKPYDYVVMHDDDLRVEPFGACEKAHGHALPGCARRGNPLDVWHAMFEADPKIGIIGAIYFRESPLLPNVQVNHPTNREEGCHLAFKIPAEPFAVRGIATGFMMIRREVLEAMKAIDDADGEVSMFRFARREISSGFPIEEGEDYNFCRRVIEAGWKVIADPRVSTIHCKPTGLLDYEHDSWEREWDPRDPVTGEFDEHRAAVVESNIKALSSHFEKGVKLIEIDGMACVDHTIHRAKEIREWQEAQARRKPKAA